MSLEVKGGARLSGITPSTLTQRLGELEAGGLIEAERRPGGRQVWYRLTPAGRDLTPTIDALGWLGQRHAWRPPVPDESLHVEHLLQAITRVLDRTSQERDPARWHLRFRDVGDYLVESDGQRWSLTMAEPHETLDVSVTATTATWKQFVLDPTPSRARALGVELSGDPPAIARFERLIRSWREAVQL